MKTAISEASIKAMLTREKALFIQRNPKSKGHSDNAARNWLRGVPMHWMVDWGTPFPLFIEKAQGVDLTDADGNTYIDFCLGDTGAMFGHSPKPVVDTLLREGAHGFTTMLPSASAVKVGKLLRRPFQIAGLADHRNGVRRQPRGAALVPRHHRPQENPGLQPLLSRRRG